MSLSGSMVRWARQGLGHGRASSSGRCRICRVRPCRTGPPSHQGTPLVCSLDSGRAGRPRARAAGHRQAGGRRARGRERHAPAVGEAGIGKSALLEDAAAGDGARHAGAARGRHRRRAGGAVRWPAAAPAPRAGPSTPSRARRPGARLGARAGAGRSAANGSRSAPRCLSLLSRVAEDRPLAVIVDDAHLLDPPSAQALCFAARRLTADPVVVLLAAPRQDPSVVGLGRLLPLTGGSRRRRRRGLRGGGSAPPLGRGPVARLRLAGRQPARAARAHRRRVRPARAPGAPVPVPAASLRTFARRPTRSRRAARTAPWSPRRRRGPRLAASACAAAACRGPRRSPRRSRPPLVTLTVGPASRSATTWSAPASTPRRRPAPPGGAPRPRGRPSPRPTSTGARGTSARRRPPRTPASPVSSTRPRTRVRHRGAYADAAAAFERAALLTPGGSTLSAA